MQENVIHNEKKEIQPIKTDPEIKGVRINIQEN